MPTYRFVGPEPEDFPAPPLARRLSPGDVVEVPEPVEHARLELVPDAPPAKGTKAGDPASTEGG